MLFEFKMKNFKSFKEELVFSLIPSKVSSLNNHVITNDKYEALKSSVIYGANGAGKTTLMDGFSFMCDLIKNSPSHIDGRDLIDPFFAFDKKMSKKPIEFSISFFKNKSQYEYSFSYTHKGFLTEQLQQTTTTGKLRKVFDRKKTDVTFGSTFKKGKGFKKALDSLQDNQLLISASDNNIVFSDVLEFVKQCHFIYDPDQIIEFTNHFIHQNMGDKKFQNTLKQILSRVDIGLETVHVLKVTAEEMEKRLQHFPNDLKERIIKEHRNKNVYEVFFKHHGSDHLIPYKDESKGTQKLYSLLGPILSGHIEESIIFFDEFNSSLHPALSEFIIDMLHNQKQIFDIDFNNQYVFNLHDTSLLTPEIFRADQIWFVDKNNEGSSELFSLDDFKDRSNLYQRNYLDGKYGAVPVIKRFK